MNATRRTSVPRRTDARRRIETAARRRAEESRAERARVLRLLLEHRPLEAEPDLERTIRRIERRVGVSRSVSEALARRADPATLDLTPGQEMVATAIRGNTVDFLPIAFVEEARVVANAVGRLVDEDDAGTGTCFMISRDLLITNHHVLRTENAARRRRAAFNFERDVRGQERTVTRFKLNPGKFFLTDSRDDMDFTVVALGDREEGLAQSADLGFCPLSERNNKHVLGDFVNIIQHPEDNFDPHKQIVLRENRLVHRTGNVLLYAADTLGGASGAPVFNDEWEVVALHHFSGHTGSIELPGGLELPDDVNEGIRASAIVRELRARRDGLEPEKQALLDVVLTM